MDLDEDDYDNAGSSSRKRTNAIGSSSRRADDQLRAASSTSSYLPHHQPAAHPYPTYHPSHPHPHYSTHPAPSSSRTNGKSLYYLPSSKGDRVGFPAYDLSSAPINLHHPVVNNLQGPVPVGMGGSPIGPPGQGQGQSAYPGHQRKRSFFSTSGVLPGSPGYVGPQLAETNGGPSLGDQVGNGGLQSGGGVSAGGWGY